MRKCVCEIDKLKNERVSVCFPFALMISNIYRLVSVVKSKPHDTSVIKKTHQTTERTSSPNNLIALTHLNCLTVAFCQGHLNDFSKKHLISGWLVTVFHRRKQGLRQQPGSEVFWDFCLFQRQTSCVAQNVWFQPRSALLIKTHSHATSCCFIWWCKYKKKGQKDKALLFSTVQVRSTLKGRITLAIRIMLKHTSN